jgi:hypothetical protein
MDLRVPGLSMHPGYSTRRHSFKGTVLVSDCGFLCTLQDPELVHPNSLHSDCESESESESAHTLLI